MSYYAYEEERISAVKLSERFTRHARKDYQCGECGRGIFAGDPYWREFWLVEGEPYTRRIHNPGCGWEGYPIDPEGRES